MLFDQISGDMVRNSRLAEQAQANSIEQFKQVFEPEVMKAFVQRQGRNQKIVNDFMSDKLCAISSWTHCSRRSITLPEFEMQTPPTIIYHPPPSNTFNPFNNTSESLAQK